MAGFEVDVSEVRRLAVDLGKAAAGMLPEVDAVVKKAAQNIKDEMVADANGSAFAQIARTITYDRAYSITGEVAYEVGPDRDRGGAASLEGAYLGWPNGGGGSLSLDTPVEHEEPRMAKAFDQLLGRIRL